MSPRLTTLKPSIATIDTRRGAPVAVERIRGGRLRAIRQRIMLRDGYTCQVCGRVTADGQVDHKTPLHLGGAESDENRWYLCTVCHDEKTEQEQQDRGRVNSLES